MPDDKAKQLVTIYVDGACSGNPGPGGWGAILIWKDRRKEISGGDRKTTNNRMELTAAIRALEALKKPLPVEVYCDSEYVVKGITEWAPAWKQRGWLRDKKKPVENLDLWKQLDALNQKYDVTWKWVRGHAGNELNERADRLAVEAIEIAEEEDNE